jgi:hypothetical protein
VSSDTATDRPGAFLELCAKIDAHIGAVRDLSNELRKPPPRPKPPAQPVFGRTVQTGVFATGVPLVFRFPLAGPDQGHFWYVRSITISGLVTTTVATGRADIFISASNFGAGGQASLASIGVADWRDQAATLPNVAFYSRGALPLRMNEEIIVVITGATNGQQYVAGVQFEDFEESGLNKPAWDL